MNILWPLGLLSFSWCIHVLNYHNQYLGIYSNILAESVINYILGRFIKIEEQIICLMSPHYQTILVTTADPGSSHNRCWFSSSGECLPFNKSPENSGVSSPRGCTKNPHWIGMFLLESRRVLNLWSFIPCMKYWHVILNWLLRSLKVLLVSWCLKSPVLCINLSANTMSRVIWCSGKGETKTGTLQDQTKQQTVFQMPLTCQAFRQGFDG